MRSICVFICAALCCVGLACSDDAQQANNDGWDIGHEDAGKDAGEDAHADTGRDGGDDGGGHDGGTINYEVVFELVNESGGTVYAHDQIAGMPCAFGDNHWLSVNRNGVSWMRLSDGCHVCNCDEPDDCAVCAYDCPGQPMREWTELADGEARRFTWDGRIWETTEEGCEMPELAVGQPLEAEFCWGTGFDDENYAITGSRCLPVDFELEPGGQVVRVVIPERETHDITFRMINETGKDLYANPDGATQEYGCYGSWYTVGNGDETYTLMSSCGLCDCSTVEQNPDEMCHEPCPDIACPAPTEEAYRFAAGEELSDTWSGKLWAPDQVGDQACERQTAPPQNELVATFCYAEEVVDGGGYASLGPTTCQQVSFDRLADDEVVLRLQ
jgi:hypothetical protein